MNEIAKKTSLEKYAESQEVVQIEEINVGDFFIDDYCRVYKIFKVLKDIVVVIEYPEEEKRQIEMEWFKNNKYVKMHQTYEEYEKEALALLNNIKEEDEEEEISEETALASSMSKEFVIGVKNDLVAKARKHEILKRILDQKLAIFHDQLHGMLKQVKRIEKVIAVIELYLGIHEEVIQIQEGAMAASTEQLSIRQMLLYMDEEVGVTEDQGLDFQDIKVFDDWLLNGNLDKILPEKKGLVAIRVRREGKEYGDIWANVNNNAENFKTYILIRNGDNVYRIWAPINVSPRLFPLHDEFDEDKMEWWDKNKIEDNQFDYKKHAMLIEGLLHRTQVFAPMPENVSIFKPETYEGHIRFICDEEASLTDGRMRWSEWRKKINKEIKIGSRIYYVSPPYSQYEKLVDHVAYQYQHASYPNNGVYKVVNGIDGIDGQTDEDLRFIYNPDDIIYSYDYYVEDHKRKKGIGYKYYSDEVLNYDQISVDDIDYYINCRLDRRNYLDMLPILKQIKKMRLKELEREKQFVRLITDRNNVDESAVWKAVEWWKYKNKWKRPLDEDDAKALRMIEKRLKKG